MEKLLRSLLVFTLLPVWSAFPAGDGEEQPVLNCGDLIVVRERHLKNLKDRKDTFLRDSGDANWNRLWEIFSVMRPILVTGSDNLPEIFEPDKINRRYFGQLYDYTTNSNTEFIGTLLRVGPAESMPLAPRWVNEGRTELKAVITVEIDGRTVFLALYDANFRLVQLGN